MTDKSEDDQNQIAADRQNAERDHCLLEISGKRHEISHEAENFRPAQNMFAEAFTNLCEGYRDKVRPAHFVPRCKFDRRLQIASKPLVTNGLREWNWSFPCAIACNCMGDSRQVLAGCLCGGAIFQLCQGTRDSRARSAWVELPKR